VSECRRAVATHQEVVRCEAEPDLLGGNPVEALLRTPGELVGELLISAVVGVAGRVEVWHLVVEEKDVGIDTAIPQVAHQREHVVVHVPDAADTHLLSPPSWLQIRRRPAM
jgi:hypothetical protein